MNLPPVLKQYWTDDDGNPLAGGKIYTYQAGTSTPQATYTDYGGGTANANPVVLDASGWAAMWLDPTLSYKFIIKDSDDNTIHTIDNVVGLLDTDSVPTAAIQDDAVTTAKIADDAVTADKLRDDASTDANRAVTTNHIRDGAITGAKLAAAIVDNSTIEIASNTLRVKDAGITKPKLAALGQQTSSSCGLFSYSTLDQWTDVTNLSVTITTTGRPVYLALVSATASDTPVSTEGYIRVGNGSTSSTMLWLSFVRDSTRIANNGMRFPDLDTAEYMGFPVSSICHIDVPSAGTYTYKVQMYIANISGGAGFVYEAKLIAFEL